MKKALNIFFVVLGVVFLCILIALGGIFLYIFGQGDATTTMQETMNTVTGGEESTDEPANQAASAPADSNSMLNASQEAALETFGIDPASLPSTISHEQEACFIEAIGAARVEEIKAGDTPTATEIFKGRGCL